MVYVHENMKLIDGLVQIIGQALNWRDLCKGGLYEYGGMQKETTALFSLEYTIPHTQLKDVQLHYKDDWKTFLEEVSKKVTAQGKLVIMEKQMSIANQQTDTGIAG
jgi:hypothetical protein